MKDFPRFLQKIVFSSPFSHYRLPETAAHAELAAGQHTEIGKNALKRTEITLLHLGQGTSSTSR
jgi:hypothetical protein